jgi:hypothetical protein
MGGCGLARVGRADATVRAFAARLALAVEHDSDRDRREDDYRDQDRHDRGRATTTAGFSLVGDRSRGAAAGDSFGSADAVIIGLAALAARLGAFATAAVTAAGAGRATGLRLFVFGTFFRFLLGRRLFATGRVFRRVSRRVVRLAGAFAALVLRLRRFLGRVRNFEGFRLFYFVLRNFSRVRERRKRNQCQQSKH